MKTTLLNSLCLLTVLVCASGGALWVGQPPSPIDGPASRATDSHASTKTIVDARGHSVPIQSYQRIVSLMTVADSILLEMVSPQQLVAITAHTHKTHPLGYRFGDRVSLSSSKNLEAVLQLSPDLVVVSRFADEAYMTRLREQGIVVFDLGEMRGVHDTLRQIQWLSSLLNLPERGKRIANNYIRNLKALEQATELLEKPSGIYLNIHGDQFFGGTDGSSYADLLHYGGVIDLAAQQGFKGWPQYNVEQLMKLDPPLIITAPGRQKMICEHTLLSRLSACKSKEAIIELPSGFLNDPGLGLVYAAQSLQTSIHHIQPHLKASP